MIVNRNFRTAVFIDGHNLFSTMRKLEWNINFDSLLEYFQEGSSLIRAHYYTNIIEGDDNPLKAMLDYLDFNGWRVKARPMKRYTNREGDEHYKGNFDLELAIDVFKIIKHVDNIILFTGDADYVPLVAAIQDMGKVVTVVSSTDTTPNYISNELRRQCDDFFEINDYRKELERKKE